MHLKSISVKGFKSFPDRTRLEFGPGVSVIVGPNGSGKSNITDAVLWALGEQSPLAVRGQTMQDVIFAGSAGVKGRSAAEVEIVIDNADRLLNSDFAEISVSRYLDRSGEGVYRLNGARCRLVDVLEVLSDSGLGKEMHSVISQGRVEGIIHSKAADRTVLIEEAAGLSKHRKRRHRAQLKLGRTQDNLDRALDVEREARSRLRPLKRQAEAAELHARLERQSLELGSRLLSDALERVREELTTAQKAASEARNRRDALETEQSAVAHRREDAERTLADHGRVRERLAERLYASRSAIERMAIRLESVRSTARALASRLDRSRKALTEDGSTAPAAAEERVAELEAELERLERARDEQLGGELDPFERDRRDAEARAAELGQAVQSSALRLDETEQALARAREATGAADERTREAARGHAALQLEVERASARRHEGAQPGAPSLADVLTVDEGYREALAGALGGRLTATIVEDMQSGARALSGAGAAGGRALVKGRRESKRSPAPPVRDAVRLLDCVQAEPEVRELIERLLADAWVVSRIEDVPDDFEGIAVTRDGTAYHGVLRQLRRLPAGEHAIDDRPRREQLEAKLAQAATALAEAVSDADRATDAERAARDARERAEEDLRDLRRRLEEAREQERRAAWLIEQRREDGTDPSTARRRELVAELAAERRLAESLARDRAHRAAVRTQLEAAIERDGRLLPAAEQLATSVSGALAAARIHVGALEQELTADEEVGESAAAELRMLAQAEYDVQARLRESSELLTQEEVRVAQVRDRERATATELEGVAQRLGLEPGSPEALAEEERVEIEARLDRLERRRERLGPVNPLAEHEYQDAIEHVEELERQRKDLEQAMAELEGLIRETDRRIRESFEQTFAVAARNFEDVIQHLFPGGRGRLRLVKPQRPRVVLGGAEAADEAVSEGEAPGPFAGQEAESADPEAGEGAEPQDETPGVEIEVTPEGKATKRLSLLSGGEKSLVALAFLFAVFLARPCPFYILDEVEAALDDLNIDRFLDLVRRYSERSQFIVITHQRRTMEAADVLYGVTMGANGISKVVSRRLEAEPGDDQPEERLTEAA